MSTEDAGCVGPLKIEGERTAFRMLTRSMLHASANTSLTPPKEVSVILPTLREAENLPALCALLEAMRSEGNVDLEVLLMDDDSRDGSREWVDSHAPSWVRLVARTENFGLGPAVVDGISRARNPYVVVGDADLSHPLEKIPEMISLLDKGYDLVIGSRYVDGGSTGDDWHWWRAMNSRIATWLARPLTSARDPMAGFFAFRRSLVERGAPLDPIGFKIGLELIVKCGVDEVAEIPIGFSRRRAGKSKLNLREQVRYLRHLWRLYLYKFGNGRHRNPRA